MFSMFSPDSKIMQVLSRLADLVILNVLFLITCLPLFTVGAAFAALYTGTFRLLRGEEGHVVRGYFRAFRDNFRQGTVLWLVTLFLAVPTYLYFERFFQAGGFLRWGSLLFLSVLVLTVMAAGYAFPWLSQFCNDAKTTGRNALILCVSYLPRSLAILVINSTPVLLWILNYDLFLKISFLWIALYFSAAAYMNSSLLLKVFQPYRETQE